MSGEDLRIDDDLTIADDSELWRKITPLHVVQQPDGGQRLSSAAFQNREGDKLSVLLEDTVRETGRTEADILAGFDGYKLASIPAGSARDLGQAIVRAPEEGEPAHCHMVGKKSKSVKRRLARSARIIFPNPD